MAKAKPVADDSSDIVSEAKARFERAKDALSANRALAVQDTKFVFGDSDNGWQWPEQIYTARNAVEKRPCLTVNVTAQHCNQIINNIRQNRPQCKVLPADSHADKKTAEILAGLIRNIQVASQADVAHDTAAEHAIYGGEGYWRVCTDYETPTSFDQVINIVPIENPQLVYIDPFCGMDRLKAQWGFVFEDITKEECKRLYKIEPASWQDDGPKGWVSENTVRIADYYYCENVADTLYLLPDGTAMLESEASVQGKDVLEQVKAAAAALAAQTGGKTSRATATPKWSYCKLIGGHDKPVDEKEWAGNYLPIIGVVGKELNVNGKIIRKGVVRDLKDPARMVNYSYSSAIETVALQNKIPYIAAAEAIEDFEDQWKNANQSTASVLNFNAFDEAGNAIPKPERQQPAVMPQAQVAMLQLSVEQMRAASGQQNSNFGIKSEAASGIGIQRLKVQGETATFHFPDNLARGLHDEAVVLIDLIPKIYDTRRVVRILGIDGSEDHAMLDPSLPVSHSDDDALTQGDVSAIFNPTVGRYDVVIDTGPSYQTQRAEGAAAMTELATRNPQLMQVAGDIIVRAYDFPFSEQLANRLKKAQPPQFQDDDEKSEIPPQMQAAMQQMQQQMEQMGQALQNAGQQVDRLTLQNQQKDAQIAQEKAARAMAQTDAHEAESLLVLERETGKAKDAISAQPAQPAAPAPMPPAPPPLILVDVNGQASEALAPVLGAMAMHSQGTSDGLAQVSADQGQMLEILMNESQQTRAMLAEIARPKSASVRITRDANGDLVGTKVEQ